jgi:hypothetical protein
MALKPSPSGEKPENGGKTSPRGKFIAFSMETGYAEKIFALSISYQ